VRAVHTARKRNYNKERSMEGRLYEPADVAEALQVDGSTVRRYCEEFAEFLSESARIPTNDGRGLSRRFTQADLAVLTEARQLLSQGRRTSYQHVRALLREGRQPIEPSARSNGVANAETTSESINTPFDSTLAQHIVQLLADLAVKQEEVVTTQKTLLADRQRQMAALESVQRLCHQNDSVVAGLYSVRDELRGDLPARVANLQQELAMVRLEHEQIRRLLTETRNERDQLDLQLARIPRWVQSAGQVACRIGEWSTQCTRRVGDAISRWWRGW
jgi:uncharacterized protein YqiB (DUF1249 family)